MHGKLFVFAALAAWLALASCKSETAKSQRENFSSFLGWNSWKFTPEQLYDKLRDRYNWFHSGVTGRDIAGKLMLIGETNGCNKNVLEALDEFKELNLANPTSDIERVLRVAIERAKLTDECKAAAEALSAGPRDN